MTQTSIPVEQQHPIAAGCAWCGKPTSTQTSIGDGSSGKVKHIRMSTLVFVSPQHLAMVEKNREADGLLRRRRLLLGRADRATDTGKREAMLAEVEEIQVRLRRDGFSWS
jgi:hypothetical protein